MGRQSKVREDNGGKGREDKGKEGKGKGKEDKRKEGKGWVTLFLYFIISLFLSCYFVIFVILLAPPDTPELSSDVGVASGVGSGAAAPESSRCTCMVCYLSHFCHE